MVFRGNSKLGYRAALASLALLSLQIACATPTQGMRVSVGIDALATPDAGTPRRVFVAPQNPKVSKLDLEFIEFERYANFILRSRGFTVVQSPNDAELTAFLAYGISEPQTNLASFTTPAWSTVYSTTSSYVAGKYVESTTTGVVVGSKTQTVSYETYNRVLALTAYDTRAFQERGETREVFRVVATSKGVSGDLRVVAPHMAVAMAKHVARRTPQGFSYAVQNSDLDALGGAGLLPSGAQCKFDAQCGPGLACGHTGERYVCEIASPGAPCTTDSQCKEDFICRYGECAASKPWSVMAGTTARRAGESCASDAECDQGLVCAKVTPTRVLGMCTR